MIELSDSAMSIIRESQNGQPLQFVNPDYRNYSFNAALPNAVTQLSMPIPAKFSSLKSLFLTVRDAAAIGANTFFPYSCNRFNLSSYFFRVGSQVLPSKVPDTTAEMFSEVCKAIGSMSALGTPIYGQSAVHSGSFYVGLDLENYANADKSAIFSGWNSNTDDIFFVPTFDANNPAIAAARLDAFALFDTVIVFENGTCYVKY